ncbi:AraC family transcriptional regulator [Zoogloea sp.]|uniref:AraC family transcriptional regulator n=1 Tax=Zoogloea sp. TaxID=49181 RepID=UPI0025D41665|nr:AraC family transcriptional regulator [Zoogloea sp.]MCK6393944.1 AraC family transcriptional regulator [Zoogloea sp.]
MGFVTGMLAGMLRRNINPALLLAELDIDLADAATRVPLDRYATLYNLVIRELHDEGFGLFSGPMGPGSFEFLCRGMLGAPTLADGLDRARRFLAIVLPDLQVCVVRGDDRAELHIREAQPLTPTPDDPARVFAFEWLLRLLHSLSCWLVGRGLSLDSVDFPFSPPAHADDYALVYTARSRFIDGPQLTARFNATLLDLPIRRDEAALSSFLEGAPGRISMLYRRDRNTVTRVRDLIRDALPASLTQDEAADRLHMSPRTLHRRLEEEGASFRGIKEALRRDMALARLTKTRQPISQVAADLGYADTSAFYRAFTGWTGMSPERYRKHLSLTAPPSGDPQP